jgi:hypothetical protein
LDWWIGWVSAAAVATLFSSIVNWYLAFLREKNKLRLICRHLLYEVNRQCAWFQGIAEGNKDCARILIESPSVEWEKSRYELVELNYKEFELLMHHYENVPAVKDLAETVIQDRHFHRPPENIIDPIIETSLQSVILLRSICENSFFKRQYLLFWQCCRQLWRRL